MRTIMLILSLIGIVSCNQIEDQDKSNHFSFRSKWTFIKKDIKIEKYYAEIIFSEDSTLIIHSELDGQIGPFQYSESDNVLTFNNVNYSIISDTNDLITLRYHSGEFLLYKIPFDEINLKKNQIDPFYIRRCYFLVNLNIITADDAAKYLWDIVTFPQDSFPEDEFLTPTQK